MNGKPIFLFMVGPPGVGKTTLVRLLLDPENYLHPAPKWTVGKAVCAVGHYTGGTFDGGDTVPFNGAAACLAWWEQNLWDRPLTILDGDRFATAPSLAWCHQHGAPKVVHLVAPQALLDARRAERGSTQNEAWAKGRATKAERFAMGIVDRLVLEADRPPAELAAEVRAWVGALR